MRDHVLAELRQIRDHAAALESAMRDHVVMRDHALGELGQIRDHAGALLEALDNHHESSTSAPTMPSVPSATSPTLFAPPAEQAPFHRSGSTTGLNQVEPPAGWDIQQGWEPPLRRALSATAPPARIRPPDPPRPAVQVESLTKVYRTVRAVDQLSFALTPGTVTGFLGANGAGKTTTLRLLLGLAQPTSGKALVFGRRYSELQRPTTQVGAVLESNDFHPWRSGRNHLRALAHAAGIPADRIAEVLEIVELSGAADRPVGGYSLGMRQRLGLASALLGDPKLLILDEPANGLDPVGVHWLRNFIRGFAELGRTVLVSSHVLAEVAQTVDRVVIIHRGRLMADARLDEVAGPGESLEAAYLRLTGGGRQ